MTKAHTDTPVKICGITSVEDASCALESGATWIGLNLVRGPRRIDLARAGEILAELVDSSSAVILAPISGDTIDESIAQLMLRHRVRMIQPYGEVTPGMIRSLSRRGFEVILPHPAADDESVRSPADLLERCADSPPAYLLFDAGGPGRLGGTGTRANWASIVTAREDGLFENWPPMILAGGLTPECVGEAIRTVMPHGVDVSSGVETIPGRKDHSRIEAFMAAVRAAGDQRRGGE